MKHARRAERGAGETLEMQHAPRPERSGRVLHFDGLDHRGAESAPALDARFLVVLGRRAGSVVIPS